MRDFLLGLLSIRCSESQYQRTILRRVIASVVICGTSEFLYEVLTFGGVTNLYG
jgi:hypothetical protein